MNTLKRSLSVLVLLLMASLVHASSYQYFRIGNKNNIQTKPSAGVAMMGGGGDLDEAFRWLCQKGNGGDFLILRASGNDDYNSYVNGLCKLNSVATLILPNRETAQDPAVAEIIRQAEVVFVSGGDQGHYIRAWKGTPDEETLFHAASAHHRPQKAEYVERLQRAFDSHVADCHHEEIAATGAGH